MGLGMMTRYSVGRPYSRVTSLRVGVFLCLLVLPLLIGVVSVSGQEPTTLRLRPAVAEISPGDSIIVEITVENAVDLYKVDVDLLFDPNVLYVKDANPNEEGIQVQPGSFLFPDFLGGNKADNDEGTIWFQVMQLEPRDPVSGSGTLALIEFVGRSPGTSEVLFDDHLLGDPSGDTIEAVAEIGQIVVTEGNDMPPALPTDEPENTAPPTVPVPTATPKPTGTSTSTPLPLPTATSVPTSSSLSPTLGPTWTLTPTPLPAQPTEEPTQAYPGPAATQTPTAVPSPTSTQRLPTEVPAAVHTETPEMPSSTPELPTEEATVTYPDPAVTATSTAMYSPTPVPESPTRETAVVYPGPVGTVTPSAMASPTPMLGLPSQEAIEAYPGRTQTRMPTALPSLTPTPARPADNRAPTLEMEATPLQRLLLATRTPSVVVESKKGKGYVPIAVYGSAVIIGVALLLRFRRT